MDDSANKAVTRRTALGLLGLGGAGLLTTQPAMGQAGPPHYNWQEDVDANNNALSELGELSMSENATAIRDFEGENLSIDNGVLQADIGSTVWQDTDDDGLLETPEYKGIDVTSVVASDVSSDNLHITRTEDITVTVPTEFETVAEAFEEVGKIRVPSGTRVVVHIESGHELEENLELSGGDWSYVTLTSADDTVGIAESGAVDGPTAISIERGKGPQIRTMIDCTGYGHDGVRVRSGDVFFGRGSGVINAGGSNLHANGAIVWARNAEFTGAGEKGINADKGSRVVADRADVSNSNFGITSFESSCVAFRSGTANDCEDRGLTANRGSYLCAHGANVNNAGFINALSSDLSLVDVRNAHLNDAGEFACFARRGARLLADRGRISDPGVCAHFVEKGGTILASSTVGNDNTVCGNRTHGPREAVPIQEGEWTRAGLVVSDGMRDGEMSWNEYALGVSGLDGNQQIAAGEKTLVEFDSVHTDPLGNWDDSNYMYEIPHDGIWKVTAQALFRGSTEGDQLRIYAGLTGNLEGTNDAAAAYRTAGGSDDSLSATRTIYAESGDTVGTWAENRTGADELGQYETMTYLDVSFVRQPHPDR